MSAYGCLLETPNGSKAPLVLAWSPPHIDAFRYIQQIAVGVGFEVCGAGCAKYTGDALRLTAEGVAGRPSSKRKQRQLQLRWGGNAQGIGKFVSR